MQTVGFLHSYPYVVKAWIVHVNDWTAFFAKCSKYLFNYAFKIFWAAFLTASADSEQAVEGLHHHHHGEIEAGVNEWL